jgi:hypothetical protein
VHAPLFFFSALSGRRFSQAQNSSARRSTPGKSLLDVILLLRRQKISFRRTIVVGSVTESDQAKKICHK